MKLYSAWLKRTTVQIHISRYSLGEVLSLRTNCGIVITCEFPSDRYVYFKFEKQIVNSLLVSS